jgi:hypothetical protein
VGRYLQEEAPVLLDKMVKESKWITPRVGRVELEAVETLEE